MDASLKLEVALIIMIYDLTELNVVNKGTAPTNAVRGSLGNSETWMESRNTSSSSTMKPLRTAVTVQGVKYSTTISHQYCTVGPLEAPLEARFYHLHRNWLEFFYNCPDIFFKKRFGKSWSQFWIYLRDKVVVEYSKTTTVPFRLICPAFGYVTGHIEFGRM